MHLKSCTRPHEPILQVLAYPFWALRQDVGTWALPSAAFATFQLRSSAVLLGVIGVLAVASLIDWYYGTRIARWRSDMGGPAYDPIKSQMGLHGKAMTIVLIGLVRASTWVVSLAHPGWNDFGFVAAMIGFGALIREIKSVNDHRSSIGLNPIPILDHVIRVVEAVMVRIFGALPVGATPARRVGERNAPEPEPDGVP
jgi:hypothetical protein